MTTLFRKSCMPKLLRPVRIVNLGYPLVGGIGHDMNPAWRDARSRG